ncbi:ATP-binding protein [Oscillospiraceae bacterium PP1C4]
MREEEIAVQFMQQLLRGEMTVPSQVKLLNQSENPLVALSVQMGSQIIEVYQFVAELSNGNLFCNAPVSNLLAGSSKNLQSVLKHLLWQLECVADNDYSQAVDFLGDFSKGFDLFKEQIALREKYKNEKTILEKKSLEHENYLLSQQLNQQLSYYENLRAIHQEILGIKHDIKNHCLALTELLNQNKVTESKDYIHSVISDLVAPKSTVINTGNPICDALLTDKINYAKKKGITVNIQLTIREKLKVSNIDWCILLGNALDNAIEACELLNEVEKTIDVQLLSHKNILNISIRNSALKPKLKDEGRYYTSKQDEEQHGFGISNMEKVVEKYDGVLDTNYNTGHFILNMMLCDV